MALTKRKLGELLQLEDCRNTDGRYSIDYLRGISIQKKFIGTKADMEGVSLAPYILVKPDFFAYVTVTSRNGEKITLAYNDTEDTYIVSSSYVVFSILRKDLLSSDYLFMYFKRPEFDRYSRFHSWGSARETFNWEDMCNIEIELPPLPIQRKYVDIYKAMIDNQRSYESGLEDLKLVCDGYIEDLRRNMSSRPIGEYIKEVNDRNLSLIVDNVRGVNSAGTFEETRANMIGIEISNYKIVKKGQFAYNPSRINLGSIALLQNDDCIVSPMYIVFKIINEKKLLPEYLMLWLSRKEFQRSALFYATGSVRDTFEFNLMQEVQIPIPDIQVQQSIVNIYNVYIQRKQLSKRLKAQIKDICPILIKGSLEEGQANNGR